MLASTVQFSTYDRPPPRTAPPDPHPRPDAAVRDRDGPARDNRPPARSLRTQQRAHDPAPPPTPVHAPRRGCSTESRRQPAAELVSVPPSSTSQAPGTPPPAGTHHRPGMALDRHPHGAPATVLLRKEVIQPHLPVRLPCYDFVPIADPAFDGSLPPGVGPPASGVTDFRDVTGGVYKARERIHRSVADLRLLATPTSWGRVADPNPN
jgi:hypothetical protein